MKPKNNLIKSDDNISLKSTSNLRDIAENVSVRTGEAIKNGLGNPNASNGTPMDKLNGAALTTATLKNIGKEIEKGGGMIKGIETIELHAKAKATKETIDFIEKQNEYLSEKDKKKLKSK